MIKAIVAISIGLLNFQFAIPQRIVNNIIFVDLDYRYNEIDSGMLKNRLSSKVCYQCPTGYFNKDSCVLKSKSIYDGSGRLIELINTCDSGRDCIVMQSRFKKISDTLYESITKYPPNSNVIPISYYLDTTIKGNAKRIPLYKKDRENNLHVRSVYILDSNKNLFQINRYDINDKLIHVFYPYGNRSVLNESTETLVTDHDSVITFKARYNENEVLAKFVFSKRGNISAVIDENITFSNNKKSVVTKHFFYNSNDQLIRKITVDDVNRLVSEELYYYEGGSLIKYTEDDNFEDSLCRGVMNYDKLGRVILHKNYNPYNGNVYTWKYIYNESDLLEKEMYYLNDKEEYTLIYVYN